MSMTSAGGGSPTAAEDAEAESPRAAHARHLLGQRPAGARQRLGFQTVAPTGGAPQRSPSPGVGHSRVRTASWQHGFDAARPPRTLAHQA